jgi:hypothetical protein
MYFKLMKKLSILVVFVWFALEHTAFAQDSLVTYDVPKALFYSMHNDDFTVQVRKPGGQWKDLYEYRVQVDMDKGQDASMVYFDFSGKVEIKIRKNILL